MTDHGFTAHMLAATRKVDLGTPELVPDEPVRQTYDKLRALTVSALTLMRERDVEAQRIADLINAEPDELAEALWRGDPVDESISATAATVSQLRAENAHRQALINARLAATRVGVVELEAHLDEGAEAIKKAALKKASAISAKLATARRLLAEAITEHEASMGLVHLLEARAADDPTLSVRLTPLGPSDELNLAHEHVSTATAKLLAELDESENRPVRQPAVRIAPTKAATPDVAITAASEAGDDDAD